MTYYHFLFQQFKPIKKILSYHKYSFFVKKALIAFILLCLSCSVFATNLSFQKELGHLNCKEPVFDSVVQKVEKLLKEGADPDQAYSFQLPGGRYAIERSLLHCAIHIPGVAGIALINTLIKYGADIDAPDPKGRTPLMWMVMYSKSTPNDYYLSRIEKFLELGADVNKQDTYEEHTALFYAKSGIYTIPLLLSYGADPNIQDWDGKTVLSYLLTQRPILFQTHYRELERMLEILFNHGVNPYIPSNENITAVDYAKLHPSGKIRDMVLQYATTNSSKFLLTENEARIATLIQKLNKLREENSQLEQQQQDLPTQIIKLQQEIMLKQKDVAFLEDRLQSLPEQIRKNQEQIDQYIEELSEYYLEFYVDALLTQGLSDGLSLVEGLQQIDDETYERVKSIILNSIKNNITEKNVEPVTP